MTRTSAPAAGSSAPGGAALTRGINATWWYTVSAILLFELILVMVWFSALGEAGVDAWAVLAVGLGALVWCASTVALMVDYRHRTEGAPVASWRRALAPLAIAAAYGVVVWIASGSWAIALLPLVQSVVLLNWPAGVRLRVVLAATLLLAGLWVIDARLGFGQVGVITAEPSWWLVGFYTTFLPLMTVLSLWWWDVLIALDRARASEAKLAATQERLRLATDVHDLQGHHLQVIALQLELAERLMSRDPAASLQHLQTARASVDEARQGTRDLAMRFRSVPLRDELANAVDLLRAAGTDADVTVDEDADRAPADVIGPVIRETTTNVLRHGGGGWARLSLTRDASSWRYAISNDATDAAPAQDGAGLAGLSRRATDAGGTLDVRRGDGEFSVTMTVPAGGRR
ncbi:MULTISPECIES: histidine kinase [unclassified Microbacterium]|uniref:sensor histidine kinase n=1 Tax=unclassified Microbacterium TaxID=2609290 RepID=UPI00214C012F|nr:MULTISPECIES: histidine kinase [unclassified Microbacterium]MCR2785641.1 histidine kinase [Microbacterium sp. zg.B96]WIM17374.1 histidine kinase [Microbacterium sp. zg-B96]